MSAQWNTLDQLFVLFWIRIFLVDACPNHTRMVNSVTGGLGAFVAGLLKSYLGLARIFAAFVGILILDALVLFGGYVVFLKGDLQKAPFAVMPS
jgi:hypothetical protein